MKRDELIDNLRISWHRGEIVTLTLRPFHGMTDDVEVTGQIVTIGRAWTGRRVLQVAFQVSLAGLPEIIGITMIKNFRVGR